MKKIITLLFAILPLITFGQKSKKHEIGIGIGILQYTSNSFKPSNSNRFSNTLILSQKNKINLGSLIGLENSHYKQTPVFYYSYNFYKNFQIRASYQYIFQYSKTAPTPIFYEDYTPYSPPKYNSFYAEKRTNDFTIGMIYSFINKKRFNIYSGLDFSLVYGKDYESADGYYYYSTLPTNFNTSYFEKWSSFTFNIPLGLKLNLSKSFNLKYEASFYYPDAFRPINRLSLNCQF